MHSIKEGYKAKNTQQKGPSKIKCGIKTTICVWYWIKLIY